MGRRFAMMVARVFIFTSVLSFLTNTVSGQTPIPTPIPTPSPVATTTTEISCGSSTQWSTLNHSFGLPGPDLPVFSISLSSSTTNHTGLFVSTCEPGTTVPRTAIYVYRSLEDLHLNNALVARQSIHAWTEPNCASGGKEELYVTLPDGEYIVFVESRKESNAGDVQVSIACTDVDLTPTIIVCGDTVQGSTLGVAPRTAARSGDVLFSYEHEVSQSVSFSTCSPTTSFDTVLELRDGSCTDYEILVTDPPLLGSDDACGYQSAIIEENLPLGSYCLVLRGFSHGQEGAYELDVSCPIDPVLATTPTPTASTPIPTPSPRPYSEDYEIASVPQMEFQTSANEILFDIQVKAPHGIAIHDFGFLSYDNFDGEQLGVRVTKDRASYATPGYTHKTSYWELAGVSPEISGSGPLSDNTGFHQHRANMTLDLVLEAGEPTGVLLQWPMVPKEEDYMDIVYTYDSTPTNSISFENDDLIVYCGVAERGFQIETHPFQRSLVYNRCFQGEIFYSVLHAPTPTASPSASPTATPTPAPNGPNIPFLVTEAHFSSYGTEVHIDFSTETNGPLISDGSSFSSDNCEAWLTEESLELIDHPQSSCAFSSFTRLTIELSNEATVMPTEVETNSSLCSLDIRSNTNLGRFDNWETGYGGEGAFLVGLPVESAPPVARLDVPARVAPCNSEAVIISAEGSRGFAGRSKRTYQWFSPDCPSLNLQESTSFPSQTLNFSAVGAETQCTFELTVTNFMNVSSATVISQPLVILPPEAAEMELYLTIRADQFGPWQRDEIHRLRAKVELPECGADLQERIANADFSYTWVVRDINSGDLPEGDSGIVELRESVDKSYLWIRAYELEVGRNYSASVLLIDNSGGFPDASAQLDVFIEHSPLEALIAGPEVRDFYVDSRLELDAQSLSNDPEVQRRWYSEVDNDVEFLWECSYTEFDTSGGGSFVPANVADSSWTLCNSSATSDPNIVGQGVLSLDENSLVAHRAYRFTVTISKDERADSAQAYVVARPVGSSLPPLVYINVVGSSQSIDPFGTLRVTSAVVAENPVTYQWSELTQNLLQQSDIEWYLRSDLMGQNLALKSRAMKPGDRYTFSLNVTDSVTGQVGQATTTVRVKRGPKIFRFDAQPVGDFANVELTSMFRLAVDAFFEGASGLAYQFFVKTDDTEAQEVALTQADESSTVDVRLPAGNLSIIARVFHSTYIAESTTTVLVSPLSATSTPDELCDTFDIARDLIESSLTFSMDSDATFQALLAAANLLVPLPVINDVAGGGVATSNVVQCASGVQSFRNFMYDSLSRVWNLQSVHSLSQMGQLVRVLDLLSQDTSRFSIAEVTLSLDFLDGVFEILSSNEFDDATGTGGYDHEFGESLSFADSLSNLLSNVLQSDAVGALGGANEDSSNEFCEIVGSVQDHVQAFLHLEASPLLVGESAIGFIEHNVFGQAVRAGANQGAAELEVPASDVSLTLLSDAQSFVDPVTGTDSLTPMPRVTVSSVNPTMIDICFKPKEQDFVVASPMVDISIVDCHKNSDDTCLVDVGNVTFALKYDPSYEDHESDLVCSFWDEHLSDWSSEGCEKVADDVDSQSVVCQCNHLTTFAIIRSYRTSTAGISAVTGTRLAIFNTPATVMFALFYTVVGTVACMQAARMIRYMSVSRNDRPTIAQALVGVSCICEVLNLMFLYYGVHVAAFEVLSIVRYGIHYAVFALVSQQWAALFHQIMAKNNRLRNAVLKYIFFAGASFCSLVVAIMIILSAALDPQSQAFDNSVHAGSIIVAIFSVLVATVFVVYGYSIIRMVDKSSKKTKKKSESMQRTTQRIARAVFALTLSFAVESVIAICSAAISQEAFEDGFVPLQSTYLLFNLFTLVTVLYLFYNLVAKVSKTYHETRNKSSGSQQSMDRLRGNSGDSGRTSGNNSSQESDAYRQMRDKAMNAVEISTRSSDATNSVNENSAFSTASFVSAGAMSGFSQVSPPASLARGYAGDGNTMSRPTTASRGGNYSFMPSSPPRSPRSLSRREIRSARPASMRRAHRPMYRHRRIASGGGTPIGTPVMLSRSALMHGCGSGTSTPVLSPRSAQPYGDRGTSTPVMLSRSALMHGDASGATTPVLSPRSATLSGDSGASTPIFPPYANLPLDSAGTSTPVFRRNMLLSPSDSGTSTPIPGENGRHAARSIDDDTKFGTIAEGRAALPFMSFRTMDSNKDQNMSLHGDFAHERATASVANSGTSTPRRQFAPQTSMDIVSLQSVHAPDAERKSSFLSSDESSVEHDNASFQPSSV